MNATYLRSRGFALFTVGIFLVAVACFLIPQSQAESGSKEKFDNLTTAGSGNPYKTNVERKTEGELSKEDFKQVSILGSRIVNHVNIASEHLADEQHDAAKSEISKAQTLATVIRDMLPVTVVETVVTDSNGKEVYRNSDRIQDDQIPIFKGRIAVEVMEPILDAKKDAAAVKGVRLADADLIHTSVLLDLSYMERKMRRSLKLLGDSPKKALAQLVLAQKNGVRLSLNKEDHPLVEAQSALRIAQRMAEQERFDAAKANLTLARNHLELYRGLIGKTSNERVSKLDDEIAKVMSEIDLPGASEKIGGFWDRLTGWFKKDAGVVRSTEASAPKESKTEVAESK